LIIQIGVLKIYVLIILIINCFHFFSQDIHWSQINSNPLFQNPGNTGQFDADHRFSFNIKDQWRKVTKPFTSSTIGYDTRYQYYPKIGFGGIVVSDIAGDGSFKTIELKLLGSYELWNVKNSNSFRIGMDVGFNYREMNFNAYMYDNQYNGLLYDKSIQTIENNTSNNTLNYTLSLGALWTKSFYTNDQIKIGFSSFNLNKLNQSYYNIDLERDVRNLLFIQYHKKINKLLHLTPSVNISVQGKYRELLLGTLLSHPLKKSQFQNIMINYGTFYRVKDALILLIGTNINNKYLINTSYDINISQLTKASNGKGSIEFSFIYLINRKAVPKPKHLQCIDYL
jgi:type IX secretion system PorP/SprF family membrane protein